MKYTLLLVFLLLAGSPLYAQNFTPPPPKPPVCGIYYDYDAAGQRTKRSYDCRVPNDGNPTLPPIKEPSSLPIRLYPNPTGGPYTVEFLEPLQEPVHYHWYSPDGQILGGGIFSEPRTNGDIAAWADGTYILVAYLPEGAEAIRVLKITQ